MDCSDIAQYGIGHLIHWQSQGQVSWRHCPHPSVLSLGKRERGQALRLKEASNLEEQVPWTLFYRQKTKTEAHKKVIKNYCDGPLTFQWQTLVLCQHMERATQLKIYRDLSTSTQTSSATWVDSVQPSIWHQLCRTFVYSGAARGQAGYLGHVNVPSTLTFRFLTLCYLFALIKSEWIWTMVNTKISRNYKSTSFQHVF